MDNEFEQAMQDVLDYGMQVIDNLPDETIKQLEAIFGKGN